MTKAVGVIAAGVALFLASPVAAQDCAAGAGRETARIAGEVAGTQAMSVAFGPDWRFDLKSESGGWRLSIFDAAGLDLSQMTPPLHGPNPREIYGWHFRNAANTGPNEGDVNAPQKRRLFGFDPRLSGTGGWKPAPGDDGKADQPGRGALTILDFGLADLNPGQLARMIYLKFDACLSWPSEYGATAAATILPETVEQLRGCGLGPDYDLGAYLAPSSLSGDFDGDGVLDLAAPITRLKDSKRAIAICRAGTHLDILGLAGKIGVHLVAEYFDRIDGWTLTPKGDVGVGGEGGTPPVLVGDEITIGKDDSSSAMIYWDGKGWTSYWGGD
jgi:hypothetical protein